MTPASRETRLRCSSEAEDLIRPGGEPPKTPAQTAEDTQSLAD